jgi:hypothetical protein
MNFTKTPIERLGLFICTYLRGRIEYVSLPHAFPKMQWATKINLLLVYLENQEMFQYPRSN